MTLIRNIKSFPTKKQPAKHAILLCGFGGAIWQMKRVITKLNQAGYSVTALDYSKTMLSAGDPELLPQLINEVLAFAEREAKQTEDSILLVGISLGALISLNVLRRSKLYNTAIGVTGGNIVTVAKKLYGDKVWPQPYEELCELWKDVNMHTDPKLLRGKHMVFVLPSRDKLVDTSEVLVEIERQRKAGNDMVLVKRLPFSHIGTIIQETVLHPKRMLRYADTVEGKHPEPESRPA